MKEPIVLYPTFVIFACLFCLLATQFAKGSPFRIWLFELTHKEIVDKGVAVEEDVEKGDVGMFLTKYRYQSFGATNPAEVDVTAPMVALTFDDGPSENATGRILKVLEDNYSRATFFMAGTNAEKYPELVAQIAGAGCELGNHTYNHKDLTKLDTAGREEQIDLVNRAVNKATGENTTVVRPPFGAYDESVLNDLQVPVVLWNLDTEDWNSRNAQQVVENVMTQVKDGDIVLMHDIYDSTAEAVELLVPMLKERGFQIVTVSEMARYKEKDLECHKAYGNIINESQ
ncbi:MAG: polysaccharide deacetylase family protein [Lachnospiraceae bacterium]